jgi:long-subunit acyl-CoA synthetase (AMP-forming)
VVDPVTHARLPDGQQGLLLAAGPGVMSGYWQDAAATHKAFIDGWFDTGGWVGGWACGRRGEGEVSMIQWVQLKPG